MSYANGTTHYNLPQTTGTDKRDWSDTNQAFQDIDSAIYQTTQDTAQAALDIDALETRMDTAEGNITTNAGDISALDTRLTTAEGAITQHTGQIADVRQDLEDMICAYNEVTATSTHAYAVGDYFIYNDVLYRATASIGIGNTIVPDTNCTTTNVSTELLNKASAPVIYTLDGRSYSTFNDLLSAIYNIIVNIDGFDRKTVQLYSHLDSRYKSVYSMSSLEYVNDSFDNILFTSTTGDSGTLSVSNLILRSSGTNSEYLWHMTTSGNTVTPTDMTRAMSVMWMIKIS